MLSQKSDTSRREGWVWSMWAWPVGRAAVGRPLPLPLPKLRVWFWWFWEGGGGQWRRLSHLVSGAEGGPAELADLPDVFPGHHPSPPETPTYHALDVGVQAQRRWALRFAAGEASGGTWRREGGEKSWEDQKLYQRNVLLAGSEGAGLCHHQK